MNLYHVAKAVHIVSSTVLFGTVKRSNNVNGLRSINH
jgi:hypothetical protein